MLDESKLDDSVPYYVQNFLSKSQIGPSGIGLKRVEIENLYPTNNANLMPCPFTGPKMFWAGSNFLCQTKNLFTYFGNQKDDLHSVKLVFVPTQKAILLNANHIFAWHKMFVTATICK